MRRRIGAVALLAGLIGTAAFADLAARAVKMFSTTQSAVPLTAADPTGSTNGAGGYSLSAVVLDPTSPGYVVADVWCEFKTEGTAITGGSVRWWRQAVDGGWVAFGGLDESFGNVGELRVGSKPIKVRGINTRVYCQPLAVTESGAGLDGGLTRDYHFRLEQP